MHYLSPLSVSVERVGHSQNISLCGSPKISPHSIHFLNLTTPWTKEFLTKFALASEEEQLKYIQGNLKLTQENQIFRLEGTLRFFPQLECIRSLTLFREEIEVAVQSFFIPKAEKKAPHLKHAHSKDELEIELSASDLDSYEFTGTHIIFDEWLVDSMSINVPEFPLCRSDCKGICPECGCNLNETLSCLKKLKNCRY